MKVVRSSGAGKQAWALKRFILFKGIITEFWNSQIKLLLLLRPKAELSLYPFASWLQVTRQLLWIQKQSIFHHAHPFFSQTPGSFLLSTSQVLRQLGDKMSVLSGSLLLHWKRGKFFKLNLSQPLHLFCPNHAINWGRRIILLFLPFFEQNSQMNWFTRASFTASLFSCKPLVCKMPQYRGICFTCFRVKVRC